MDTKTDISVSVVSNNEELESLRSDWDNLCGQDPEYSIFQTYDWNYDWWQTYGDSHQLMVLKIKQGNDVMGIAPLMVTDRKIEFIGTPNADYSDFITSDSKECLTATIEYLKSIKDRWDQVDLCQLRANSKSIVLLKNQLGNSGLSYRLFPNENVMAYKYEGGEDDRGAFTIRKGGTMKKFINFFKKKNGLNLNCYKTAEDIGRILPDFYHSHIIWWFRRGGEGCKFINPSVRSFHDRVAASMSGKCMVRLYVLNHGDQPLAYLFAFVYQKTIHLYQIASTMSYRRKSPGILLLHMLVEESVGEGLNIIDFSRGKGGHKEKFANFSDRNMQCTIYSSGLKKSIAAAYDGFKKSEPGKKLKNIKALKSIKDGISGNRGYDTSEFTVSTSGALFTGGISDDELDYYVCKIGQQTQAATGSILELDSIGSEMFDSMTGFAGIEIGTDEYEQHTCRIDSGSTCYKISQKEQTIAMAWLSSPDHFSMPKPLVQSKLNESLLIHDVAISPVFFDPEIIMAVYSNLITFCHSQRKDAIISFRKSDIKLADILIELGAIPISS